MRTEPEKLTKSGNFRRKKTMEATLPNEGPENRGRKNKHLTMANPGLKLQYRSPDLIVFYPLHQ